MYKHKKMTKEEFEASYRAYIEMNGYKYDEDWIRTEWRYYDKGKSWYAALIDDSGLNPPVWSCQ